LLRQLPAVEAPHIPQTTRVKGFPYEVCLVVKIKFSVKLVSFKHDKIVCLTHISASGDD